MFIAAQDEVDEPGFGKESCGLDIVFEDFGVHFTRRRRDIRPVADASQECIVDKFLRIDIGREDQQRRELATSPRVCIDVSGSTYSDIEARTTSCLSTLFD